MSQKIHIAKTRELENPNQYVQALEGEFSKFAFNEERAPQNRGVWRKNVLGVSEDAPLDLEIGTGNGYFFTHQAVSYPERSLVGIELKFKPLIQTIRRALREGALNARIVRYDAWAVEELFAPSELNNIFIHFPDPWEKKRHWKNRIIDDGFLENTFALQRPGSFLEFKTDSLDYFEWAMERFKRSRYEVIAETRDLHNSEWAGVNFRTHFENLWTSKGIKINFARIARS